MSQSGIISESTAIGADIKTVTGDAGGAVGADVLQNINLKGTAAQGLSFTGTPASNLITGTIANATTAAKGVVSLATADFNVTAGAVELKDTVVKTVTTDSGALTPVAHSFSLLGGEGVDVTHAAAVITIAGEDASDVNKGIASFTAADFDVAAGVVSLEGSVVRSLTTDSGVLTPVANSFSLLGGEGINVTHVGAIATVAGEDASDVNKGIATFDAFDFVTAAGNVTLRPGVNVYFVGKWGNNAADGLTYESAKLTIQSAVSAAPANSVILLYPGTYTETVTHVANNIVVIGVGSLDNIIITQTDTNLINIGSRTGIEYRDITIRCTAATTAINTIIITTGSAIFQRCRLQMISSANVVAVTQAAVATVTGAGILTVIRSYVDYLNTGICGGTALKAAFTVGAGGVINLRYMQGITVTCSGTALATGCAFDLDSSGYFQIDNCNITVTDPDANLVIGLGYLGGTSDYHEFSRNNIHVAAGANSGYGIYADDTATVTRTMYNHIHVTDVGGLSYAFYVGPTAVLISHFDDCVSGDEVSGTGTFTRVYSPQDGELEVSGRLTANSMVLDGITAGYANSEEVSLQAGVQTVGAAATPIATIALPTNTACALEARFIGFKDNFSAACGGYLQYTSRRAGGAAVEVAAPIVNIQEDSAAAPTVDADVSGNDIRLLVSGVAAETYNWVVTYRYHFVQTSA